jgi:hypothetical protein
VIKAALLDLTSSLKLHKETDIFYKQLCASRIKQIACGTCLIKQFACASKLLAQAICLRKQIALRTLYVKKAALAHEKKHRAYDKNKQAG